MGATEAIASKGVVFKRSSQEVAEVISIGELSITQALLKATQLNAPNGMEEYIKGFKDTGELSLGLNFTRDGWVDFSADFDSTSPVSYSVVFPDIGNTTITFSAHCVGVSVGIPENNRIPMTVRLKPTTVFSIVS